MLKQELCQFLELELKTSYNTHEINNLANYFIAHWKETQKQQVIHLKDLRNEKWILDWVFRLQSGEPIQYISGIAPFINLNLKINRDVLIPRSETEELAHKIYLENKEFNSLKVLDIGSGSGCISLYLKSKKNDWELSGIDVSKTAVDCSVENAKRLQLDVEYRISDFLNVNEWPEKSMILL
ncbi:MAG: methyltransferase [Saprospiraceae bacterium]|nr:methyltransferase [Saprospiraceae bacterium]